MTNVFGKYRVSAALFIIALAIGGLFAAIIRGVSDLQEIIWVFLVIVIIASLIVRVIAWREKTKIN